LPTNLSRADRADLLHLLQLLDQAEADRRQPNHDWTSKVANRRLCRQLEAKIEALMPMAKDPRQP
jgi:hypothetical protein